MLTKNSKSKWWLQSYAVFLLNLSWIYYLLFFLFYIHLFPLKSFVNKGQPQTYSNAPILSLFHCFHIAMPLPQSMLYLNYNKYFSVCIFSGVSDHVLGDNEYLSNVLHLLEILPNKRLILIYSSGLSTL